MGQKIKPLSASLDGQGEEEAGPLYRRRVEKSRDRPVSTMAVEKIAHNVFGLIAERLVRTIASPFLFRLFKTIINESFEKQQRKEEMQFPSFSLFLEEEEESKVPIGIYSNKVAWINALLQFILFIPSVKKSFEFVPKSLFPLRDFMDCYERARNRKESAINLDTHNLLYCFYKKFGNYIFKKDQEIYLHEILFSLIQFIQKLAPNKLCYHQVVCKKKQCECLSLDQHIADQLLKWKKERESEEEFFLPKELFLAFEEPIKRKREDFLLNPAFQVKKQYFFSSAGELSLCYDLEAFIECRFDSDGERSYATYVKRKGAWYMCDDLRIKRMRSLDLIFPMSQSPFFYYKKSPLPHASERWV